MTFRRCFAADLPSTFSDPHPVLHAQRRSDSMAQQWITRFMRIIDLGDHERKEIKRTFFHILPKSMTGPR
ncbi:hypothetical protein BDW75DRAFT_200629 [Aspergillus navahoensis]